MTQRQFDHEHEIFEDDDAGVRPPRRYSVIMHNDDYTTMEFVVAVLISVFHQTKERAVEIMQAVHDKGRAVAGTYTFEIAETRAHQAMTMARNEGYPLKCTLKRE